MEVVRFDENKPYRSMSSFAEKGSTLNEGKQKEIIQLTLNFFGEKAYKNESVELDLEKKRFERFVLPSVLTKMAFFGFLNEERHRLIWNVQRVSKTQFSIPGEAKIFTMRHIQTSDPTIVEEIWFSETWLAEESPLLTEMKRPEKEKASKNYVVIEIKDEKPTALLTLSLLIYKFIFPYFGKKVPNSLLVDLKKYTEDIAPLIQKYGLSPLFFVLITESANYQPDDQYLSSDEESSFNVEDDEASASLSEAYLSENNRP